MSVLPATIAEIFHAPANEEERFLPEGPRWMKIAGREAIMWVNIQTAVTATTGTLHAQFLDNGETRSWPQEKRPGFVLPTTLDHFVLVGREKELGLFDLVNEHWTWLVTIPDTHPHTIINDGEVSPDEHYIIFGTKDVKFADALGHLYLFDLRKQQLLTLASHQTCSNGKIIQEHAGRTLLYDIDSPKRSIQAYEWNATTGKLEKHQAPVSLEHIEGFPDGMCDAGNETAIVAFYNPSLVSAGKAVRLSLQTGEILEEWHTPGSPRVTCPLLVSRPDGADLILTTASEGMSPEQRQHCPNAGALFIARTKITGVNKTPEVRI